MITLLCSKRNIFVQNELDNDNKHNRQQFRNQFPKMQIVYTKMQNHRTEKQPKDAYRKKDHHTTYRMIRHLEVILPVQQKTT
jgi:hypothetical protein